MSESVVVNFIHSIREADKAWKELTKEQRRAVLKEIGDNMSEYAVLIAIRTITTGQQSLKF